MIRTYAANSRRRLWHAGRHAIAGFTLLELLVVLVVMGLIAAIVTPQVMSMLSLLSFLGKGEDRSRYLGIKIPSASLKPDYLQQCRAFATDIANSLGCGPTSATILNVNATILR